MPERFDEVLGAYVDEDGNITRFPEAPEPIQQAQEPENPGMGFWGYAWDIAKAPVKGVVEAGANVLELTDDTARDIAGWITSSDIPEEEAVFGGVSEAADEFIDVETVPGEVVSDISRLAAGYFTGKKLIQGFGIANTLAQGTWRGKLAAETIYGSTGAFLVGNEEDSLATAMADLNVPYLDTIAETLRMDPNDPAVLNRLRLAAEDGLLYVSVGNLMEKSLGWLAKRFHKLIKGTHTEQREAAQELSESFTKEAVEKMNGVAEVRGVTNAARRDPRYGPMVEPEEVPITMGGTRGQFYRDAVKLREMIEQTDRSFFTPEDPRLTQLWDILQRMPPREASETLGELGSILKRPRSLDEVAEEAIPQQPPKQGLRRRGTANDRAKELELKRKMSGFKGSPIERKLQKDRIARQEALAEESLKKNRDTQLTNLVNRLVKRDDIKIEVVERVSRGAKPRPKAKGPKKATFGFGGGKSTIEEAREWISRQYEVPTEETLQGMSKELTRKWTRLVGVDGVPEDVATIRILDEARMASSRFGATFTDPQSLKAVRDEVSEKAISMSNIHELDVEQAYKFANGIASNMDEVQQHVVTLNLMLDLLKKRMDEAVDLFTRTNSDEAAAAMIQAKNDYVRMSSTVGGMGRTGGRLLGAFRGIGRANAPIVDVDALLEDGVLRMTVPSKGVPGAKGAGEMLEGRAAKKDLAKLVKMFSKDRLSHLAKKYKRGEISPREFEGALTNKLVTYYLNNIFSGQGLGWNAFSGLLQITTRPGMRGIGGVTRGIAGRSPEQISAAIRRTADEYLGVLGSLSDAWLATKKNWQTGMKLLDVGSQTVPPAGRATLTQTANPFYQALRVIGATDEFFDVLATRAYYSAELADGWRRKAAEDGAEAATNWFRERWSEFTKSMNKYDETSLEALARSEGRSVTFTGDIPTTKVTGIRDFPMNFPPVVISNAQRLLNDVPILRLVVPIVRTPAWIVKEGFEMVPVLGVLPRFFRDGFTMLSQMDEQAANVLIGKQVAGAVMSAGAYGLWSEGLITGSGPSFGSAERELWLQKHPPRSIYLPGYGWMSYERMEPFNTVMSLMCDSFDAMEEFGRERSIADLGMNVLQAGLKATADKAMLKTFSDLLRATSGDESAGYYINRVAMNLATGMVPYSSAFRSITGMVHTEYRQNREWLNNFRELSVLAPPNTTVWNLDGTPSAPQNFFTELRMPTMDTDHPALNELLAHRGVVGIGQKESVYRVELSDEQRSEYARLVVQQEAPRGRFYGKKLIEALSEVTSSARYKRFREQEQVEDLRKEDIRGLPTTRMLGQVVDAYERLALEALKKTYPELQQAEHLDNVIKRSRRGGAGDELLEFTEMEAAGMAPADILQFVGEETPE